MLKEVYTLPFQIRPGLTRSPNIISCYVNPHRDLYLLEALHQLLDKNTVELVNNQRSLGFFFQPPIFSAQNQQQVETYTRSEEFKQIPQDSKIQNGDTRNHQDLPPTRGVGYLNRLQGCLFPHTNTGTIQEISEISHPGSDIPVKGTAIRLSAAPMEFTAVVKEVRLMAIHQGIRIHQYLDN